MDKSIVFIMRELQMKYSWCSLIEVNYPAEHEIIKVELKMVLQRNDTVLLLPERGGCTKGG
jgi:hypothetical protein